MSVCFRVERRTAQTAGRTDGQHSYCGPLDDRIIYDLAIL